jgi:hypothetical protein
MNYKKLTVTMLGAALIAGMSYLGVDPAMATKIVGLLASYVIGQGLADFGKEKAKLEIASKSE